MNQIKILIVEDDEVLAKNIARFVSDIGSTTISYNGNDAEIYGETNTYDLVILDLMLPEKSGIEVLKKWRRIDRFNFPVLVLTAKVTLEDKIKTFNLGADDYLTKPFHREELVLRVKALLRRSGALLDRNELVVAGFKTDFQTHVIALNNEPLALNGKEYDLLLYFLQNPNIIITKNQIFDRLWGFNSDTSITVVEVYMSNLRKKIKKITPDQPIKTVRNAGYILEA